MLSGAADCGAILDLGCGVGRDSYFLSGQCLHVTGADLAAAGLRMTHDRQPACSSPVDIPHLAGNFHQVSFRVVTKTDRREF